MSKLIGLIVANPMTLVWIALGVFLFGVASGGSGAWWLQGLRLTAVQSRYDSLLTTTRVMGEQAQKEKEAQEKSDKLNKEKADHENAVAKSKLAAVTKRLSEYNSRKSFLPPVPSGSVRTDLACFDRTQLDAALREFSTETSAIAIEGESATVDLDTAKNWVSNWPKVSGVAK